MFTACLPLGCQRASTGAFYTSSLCVLRGKSIKPTHRQLVNPDFQGLWPLSNSFSTICQNIDGHIRTFPYIFQLIEWTFLLIFFNHRLIACCHFSNWPIVRSTWGETKSHVPQVHPQRWSHMFVKMCMLCVFSSLICAQAIPLSPILPGGGLSYTLFIKN